MTDDTDGEDDLLDKWLDEDDDSDVASAIPDPPDSEAPTADTPEASLAEGEDRGDGRDVRGKFAPKKDEEPEADAAPAPSDPAVPSPIAPDTNAPVAAEADTIAPAVEPPSQPYTVRFRGQEYEIPGSKVTPDGVLLAKDHLELVNTYIGKGIKLDAERAAMRQEKALAQIERTKANATNKEIERLLEIAAIPDETSFAEAMLTYGLELRGALPTLQREVALAEREAQFAIQREMQAPDADEIHAQVEQQIVASEPQYLAQMQASSQFAAMTAPDWAAVQRYMQQNRNGLAYRVGPRLTAEEQAEGLQPGQIAYNLHPVIAYATERNDLRAEFLASQTTHKAAVEDAKAVAAQNARKLAKATPASVTKKGATQAAPRPTHDDDDEMSTAALMREFTELVG